MIDDLDGKVEMTSPPMGPSALEIVKHFKEIDDLAADHERPSEALCAELYDVQEQKKALEAREKKLKDVIKGFRDRGVNIYGGYSLEVKERAGNKTLDKDMLRDRLTAELGKEESDTHFAACMKQGEPTIVISVKKLGATGT